MAMHTLRMMALGGIHDHVAQVRIQYEYIVESLSNIPFYILLIQDKGFINKISRVFGVNSLQKRVENTEKTLKQSSS